MSSSQCRCQTQSRCLTFSTFLRSKPGSVLWRFLWPSRTLCQFQCQHRSLCTSPLHLPHALLHTPCTPAIRVVPLEESLTAVDMQRPLHTPLQHTLEELPTVMQDVADMQPGVHTPLQHTTL